MLGLTFKEWENDKCPIIGFKTNVVADLNASPRNRDIRVAKVRPPEFSFAVK